MLTNQIFAIFIWIFNSISNSSGHLGSCGTSRQVRGAVIGGSSLSSTQRGNYPWVVAVVDRNNEYFCGGVLISVNAVLTAAHCIQDKSQNSPKLPRDVRSILGVFDLKDPYEIGRLLVATDDIRMHPKWNPDTTQYDADIALLILNQNAPLNDYIQPICVEKSGSSKLFANNGKVIGYGLSSTQSSNAENIPRILNIPIHQNEDCFLHNKELAGISSKKTFCAGAGTGTGVCTGDSGSGLYVQSGEKQYLKGIVSSSLLNDDRKCDVYDYAIFTAVAEYYEWFTETESRGSYYGAHVCNGCEFSGPGKVQACNKSCSTCNACKHDSQGRIEYCNGCDIHGKAFIDECNGCTLKDKNGLARIDVCNGCMINRNAGPVWIKLCKNCHMSSCNGCIKHKSDNRDEIQHKAEVKPAPLQPKYTSLVLVSLRFGAGFNLDYPICASRDY